TVLQAALAKAVERNVILQGDRNVVLEQAVQIMTIAKQAGADKIAIATAPPEAGEAAVTSPRRPPHPRRPLVAPPQPPATPPGPGDRGRERFTQVPRGVVRVGPPVALRAVLRGATDGGAAARGGAGVLPGAVSGVDGEPDGRNAFGRRPAGRRRAARPT